jgi:hypothetical protein
VKTAGKCSEVENEQKHKVVNNRAKLVESTVESKEKQAASVCNKYAMKRLKREKPHKIDIDSNIGNNFPFFSDSELDFVFVIFISVLLRVVKPIKVIHFLVERK